MLVLALSIFYSFLPWVIYSSLLDFDEYYTQLETFKVIVIFILQLGKRSDKYSPVVKFPCCSPSVDWVICRM